MGGCSSKQGEQNAQNKWHVIRDRFNRVEDVQDGIRAAGLESSEVILAIDFTKSNETAGRRSFAGKCLHSLDSGTNPYVTVMSIICKTLASFDDDQLISAFGFGDIASRDNALFSFAPGIRPIHTFEGVLQTYATLLPHIRLSGPTSFAPAIYQALHIVKQSGGRYHVLVIIADGQVTHGTCMESTIQAIVEASFYPLSILMVGVGDGPWDGMKKFDDELPQRNFDNFQFVNFTALAENAAQKGHSSEKWEADFALGSLMEVPDQYSAIVAKGMLGRCPDRHLPHVQVYDPPVAH